MVNPLPQVFRFLKNRLTRNILFWLLVIWFVLENRTYQYTYSSSWYYFFIAITTLLMLVLTYVNNLFLVPKILAKKKYILYSLLMLLHTAVMSVIYILVLKIVITHLPVMHIQQISLISGYVTKDWMFDAIQLEAQTYFFGFFWWVIVFTMAWYMTDYARKEKEIEAIKKKQVETELNFLKSQINPHFLFNTLNNLYALALKKSDNAPEAILKLSSLLRYLLYEASVELVDFEKEKELMQAYIDLELLRIADKTDLHFSIEADKAYKLPPLLWLPVLENVFKHGTHYIADKYFVDFHFIIEKNLIKIFSKNNFRLSNAQNEESRIGGIGLVNLRKRLTLLYPGKHEVNTKQDENTYTIEIQIQVV